MPHRGRQFVCLPEDGGGDGGARAQRVLRFFHFYPNQQRALDARTHPAWTRLKFDELVARVIRCLTRPAGASTLGLVRLK